MPTVNVNDTTLHCRFDGPEDAPVILISNSLASNLAMWDHQIDTLVGIGFRVLRYDSRGHGRSGVTPGPYSIEALAGDAVGLLDALGIERASFMGCSKGGMVGQMAGTKPRRPVRPARALLDRGLHGRGAMSGPPASRR